METIQIDTKSLPVQPLMMYVDKWLESTKGFYPKVVLFRNEVFDGFLDVKYPIVPLQDVIMEHPQQCAGELYFIWSGGKIYACTQNIPLMFNLAATTTGGLVYLDVVEVDAVYLNTMFACPN